MYNDINMFYDVLRYLGLYFDFDKNSPLYPLPLHTTYNNITLTISYTTKISKQ